LITVAAFDPHPCLVARDNLRAAQGHEGIVAPGGKDRPCAFEHVHQRALADIKPEQVAKHALQPPIGNQLVGFEIERQRMDAAAKRRALRRRRQRRAGYLAASCASASQPAVPPDDRLHLRKVDLVIFAHHIAMRIFPKWQAAMCAMRRTMVFVRIRRFGQRTGVPFVPRLCTTGARTFPFALLIGRWRP
jgi:hypothetical protein